MTSPTFTVHISFRGQRFKSRPVPCACEPDIQEGFLLELHKDSAGEAGRMADSAAMISLSDQVHIVLIKTEQSGEHTLVSSYYLEWRPVLAANLCQCALSVEMMGIGNESKVPVGILELKLELVPKIGERLAEDVVRAQISLEKSKQAERESIFSGHLDCVRFLLEDCQVAAGVRDRWYHTPLDEASTFKKDTVVRYLKDFIERSEERESGEVIFNLLNSAAQGDLPTLNRLYQDGLDMSKKDYDSRTALHLAASEGRLECVQFLVEKCHVPVMPKDRWYHTPLDEAKTFKKEGVFKYLEAQQHKQKQATAGGEIYALLNMATKGDLPGINKLAHDGVDMNMSDYDKRTALHLAAAEGQLDCVKFLIERCGAHISAKDRWGNMPLDEARRIKHEPVTRYLEKQLSTPKTKP